MWLTEASLGACTALAGLHADTSTRAGCCGEAAAAADVLRAAIGRPRPRWAAAARFMVPSCSPCACAMALPAALDAQARPR